MSKELDSNSDGFSRLPALSECWGAPLRLLKRHPYGDWGAADYQTLDDYSGVISRSERPQGKLFDPRLAHRLLRFRALWSVVPGRDFWIRQLRKPERLRTRAALREWSSLPNP